MSLQDLYQEIIIDHSKQPRNYGELANANHCKCGLNPLCGDQLTLAIRVGNEIVEDVRFNGNGCAISMASASLMTEAIKGKTVSEIKNLFDQFHHLVTKGEAKHDSENLGKLAVFSGVASFPVRVKCATLAWHTLKAAVFAHANDKKNLHPVSTE